MAIQKSTIGVPQAPLGISVGIHKSLWFALAFFLSVVSETLMADQSSEALAQMNKEVHKVQKGETLWDIAEKYLGDPLEWQQLQKAGGVLDPTRLQPGTNIPLPIGESVFPATVLHLEGRGWRLRADGSEQPLAEGMTLVEGEVIRTDTGAHLSLMFADGTKIVLPSLTTVTLRAEAGQSRPRVILQSGEIEAYVQPSDRRKRLEVETPEGVLGVRGTHFRVRDGEDETLAEVLDGKVASSRPQTEGPLIEKGYGLVLRPSGPLDTVKLLPPPISAEQQQLRGAGGQWRIRATPVDGAVSYHADVSLSPDFLQIIRAQVSLMPQFDFENLEPAFYHVRIAAVDDEGLRGIPGTYVLLHRGFDPNVRMEDVPGGVAFHWDRPEGWPFGFQVALDEDFQQPFIDKRQLLSGGVVVRRLPAGRYYWRLLVYSSDDVDSPFEVVDTGVMVR